MAAQPISMAISLFFVLNVIGNLPIFVGLLGRYSPKKQRFILVREFLIALAILLLFNFFGTKILLLLGITQPIIGIAGGILLLLIAISMIFPKHTPEKDPQHEPLIVPLATPVIAGPGSITAVMLFSSRLHNHPLMTIIICATMIISFLIALSASYVKHLLGEKGLIAFERLGGMIICLISVQMFTSGIIELVKINFDL